MRRVVSLVSLIAIATLSAPALADAKIEKKTTMQFPGMLGAMMNSFGGKSAKEGLNSTELVKGDRMLANHGRFGELIDLQAETVTRIDFESKSYDTKTFAQIKDEMQRAMERSKQQMQKRGAENPELQMEIEADIKETGAKEKIAGYDCREVQLILTMHQKGKKLEDGGGMVMTVSNWLGPKLKEDQELAQFHLRYAKKLGLDQFMLQNAQQMTALAALYPGLDKLMKTMRDKQVDMNGSALKVVMKIETVGAPGGGAGGEAGEEGSGEEPKSGLGGMFGKLAQKMQKKRGEGADEAPPSAPGHVQVMLTSTETTALSGAVGESEISIPSGFKRK